MSLVDGLEQRQSLSQKAASSSSFTHLRGDSDQVGVACSQADDSTTEFGSLMGKMQGIVWDLSHAKSTVDCVWDPTLHLASLGKRGNGGLGAHSLILLPQSRNNAAFL